jgi:integrase
MASICRHGAGWQVRIRRTGYPTQTKSFKVKRDAEAWARQFEVKMDQGVTADRRSIARKTLGDLLDAYLVRVEKKRKGHQHAYLVRKWRRHPIAERRLESLTSKDFAELRDERLAKVKTKTAREDLVMFRHAYELGRKELGFDGLTNVVLDAELPNEGPSRTRRLSNEEYRRLIGAAKKSDAPWLVDFIIILVETAMRRGELLKAEWRHFDVHRGVLHLPETKNGSPRDVPLSPKAIRVFKRIPRTGSRMFHITPDSASQAFLRLARKLGIEDLRVHDLRHEGISRLFERGDLGDIQISEISGHKSLQQLKRYAHLRAEKLAKILASPPRLPA